MNKLADNCKHILLMHMNHNWEGIDESGWLEHRLELFKKYTLPSILNQTNRDFITWIWWRSEEEGEELIKEWEALLQSVGLDFVFTFHTGEALENCNALKERVENAEYLYVTRCDTDDLLHQDFMDLIQCHNAIPRRAILPDRGYVWDIRTDKFREHEWTSPPFFTIIYPTSLFFDNEARSEYAPYTQHGEVRTKMLSIVIRRRLYIHTIHDKNALAQEIDHYAKGKKGIASEERGNILKQFGL